MRMGVRETFRHQQCIPCMIYLISPHNLNETIPNIRITIKNAVQNQISSGPKSKEFSFMVIKIFRFQRG